MTASFFARPSPNHQTSNNECDSDEQLGGRDVDHFAYRDAGQCDGRGGCAIYESLDARKGEGDCPGDTAINHNLSKLHASIFRGGLPQTVSILLCL